MSALGVAVWGLGRHARNRILPALQCVNELTLVGVCSRTEELVIDCSQKWGCHGWTDPDEMFDNPVVDIVYIATPIGVHFTLATQALKAGKHVWCEKPLTCDYEDTESLVCLAQKHRKMLVEAFMYLYHPQFSKVQNFVNDGDMGRVHSIICRFGMPILEEPGFRHDSKLGGGSFWDIACYTVSAALALFPNQHVQVLFSEICNKEKFPVDTEGRALLRFSHGAVAYLEWGIGLGYKNEIDIWSEKGSFFTDKIFSKPENYQPVYRMRDKNGQESLDYGEKSEQFIEMCRKFYNIIGSTKHTSDEYERILSRARVMGKIVEYANQK